MAKFHEDITQKPCRVVEVELKGLKRTKAELIERELDDLRDASTLSEIYTEIQKLVGNLNELDVFSGVDANITETQRGDVDACRLELVFEEKTPWSAKAKSFVQGSEAGIEGRFGLRNLRGRGEKISLFTEYGSHKMTESAIEFSKPRISSLPLNVHARVFNYMKSNSHYCSCEEKLKAISVGLMRSSAHAEL